MTLVNLPESTIVKRIVPKNAFDSFSNTKQKKLLTDYISRITWENKLSSQTINLQQGSIEEIQVFRVELKTKLSVKKVQKLLSIIDKAIPYQLIFYVEFEDEYFISTSAKHSKPDDEDRSIIDWQFNSDWRKIDDKPFSFELKNSLEYVYAEFCKNFTDILHHKNDQLETVIDDEKQIKTLKRAIEQLQSKVSKCKQFNKRVELNQELNRKKSELKEYMLRSGK